MDPAAKVWRCKALFTLSIVATTLIASYSYGQSKYNVELKASGSYLNIIPNAQDLTFNDLIGYGIDGTLHIKEIDGTKNHLFLNLGYLFNETNYTIAAGPIISENLEFKNLRHFLVYDFLYGYSIFKSRKHETILIGGIGGIWRISNSRYINNENRTIPSFDSSSLIPGFVLSIQHVFKPRRLLVNPFLGLKYSQFLGTHSIIESGAFLYCGVSWNIGSSKGSGLF